MGSSERIAKNQIVFRGVPMVFLRKMFLESALWVGNKPWVPVENDQPLKGS